MIEYQKAEISFLFADLFQNLVKQNSKRKRKIIWIQNWLLKLEKKSVFVDILEELWLQDPKNYKEYLRMNTDPFEISQYLIKL